MFEPWAALLVGAGGGIGFIAVHHAMIRFKLDDPLGETNIGNIVPDDADLLNTDAVAVHGAGGVVGLLSVPWFMYSGQYPCYYVSIPCPYIKPVSLTP